MAFLSIFMPSKAGAGVIEAINHTHWAINRFSVNGQPGIDIIGPYQGGGGGCCFSVPEKWQPGMAVRVDWETGVGDMEGFPGFGDDAKYLAWEKKMKALSRQHTRTVPLPDYNGQDTCGITIHFLPCDEIKVTTSCVTYGSPSYPIKEPIRMEEPKVCPK
ncbi:MAG: DUF3304 domain-containing protein [Pantoea sp.]|uniref:DUF3304 domain-containing protein n=1 Tax=Pantoea sp. TaxID=69393 RepID=UPI0039E28001